MLRFRVTLPTLLFAVGSFALPLVAYAVPIPFFGPIIPAAYSTCPASWGLLITVVNNIIALLITLGIVFVAPLMIAYSGFLFVVNPVNSSGIGKAREILTNTIVGIVIALAGWMIVDALMAVLYNPSAQSGTTTLGTWYSIVTSGNIGSCIQQVGASGTSAVTPSVTTVPTSVTGASGLNITQAVASIDNNARPVSIGQCAYYVRIALADGGLTSFNANHPPYAYQYGPYLTSAGFSSLSSAGYSPQAGDVIVFQPVANHPFGHIEMYDGSQWVSDFKQNNMLPSTDYQGGSYTVFRS